MEARSWLEQGLLTCVLAFGSSAALVACDTDKLERKIDDISGEDVEASVEELAEQCGLECPSRGIVEGNAAISGVAHVDAFFAAVVDYRHTASSVSAGIEAQMKGKPNARILQLISELEKDGLL